MAQRCLALCRVVWQGLGKGREEIAGGRCKVGKTDGEGFVKVPRGIWEWSVALRA